MEITLQLDETDIKAINDFYSQHIKDWIVWTAIEWVRMLPFEMKTLYFETDKLEDLGVNRVR